ncbi:type VI secretion system ImpA family N-terminal domain-containing protein [Ramlibacter sp. XY19]|uniref:type VI secretion system protein TssA n=1 Tax=Ramlibacter paludis TaxID=2908000 RepID=UPI0023DCD624|nr:type VI secretion system ImpA family N-terminal domain-containing protein [Ramlibacter paludis]MCG2595113.1 type VI secretion system ImpA family N-terminal domain-containing protein [Ramlibacter paludis]
MFSEKLIQSVSEAAPAGEEAVYTPAFQELNALAEYLAARLELGELERLARLDHQGENAESDARVAQANAEDGRAKVARAEANVKEVTGKAPSADGARNELRNRAEKMLGEVGKDLRVVQQLTLAWLMEQGVTGLGDGFRLIDALLEQYGADVHPRPDEDDPSDVSAREMVISEMLQGAPFVQALRECELFGANGGRLTGRDVEVIDGRLDDDRGGGARSVAELTSIALSIDGTPEGSNNALRAAIENIDACQQAITAVVDRFSPGALHGDRVPKLLQRARGLLDSALQSDAAAEEAPAQSDDGGIAPIVTRGGNGAASGPLRNRDDARQLILQIAKFLEETEPSHPAPFFLRRAERLLGAKDFFAIMRDMSPDAIAEMERITGHRDSGDSY